MEEDGRLESDKDKNPADLFFLYSDFDEMSKNSQEAMVKNEKLSFFESDIGARIKDEDGVVYLFKGDAFYDNSGNVVIFFSYLGEQMYLLKITQNQYHDFW